MPTNYNEQFDTNAVWGQRISAAKKYKDEWSTAFSVPKLVSYYEGKQWTNDITLSGDKPYVLNLIYSTIKIKLAGLIFRRPKYLIAPKAESAAWNLDEAMNGALLKQDVLNTLVQNPDCAFNSQIRLAALDSFFSFGIVETAYAVDWRNPNKVEPLTKAHLTEEDEGGDQHFADEKSPIVEENEIPHSERIYFKRVNPKHFYISTHDDVEISRCRWYGYWEFLSVQELRHSPDVSMPDEININAKTPNTNHDPDDSKFVKCWHIWDFVAKKRLLLLDGSFTEIWSAPFERTPHSFLRWDVRTEGFYPVPPVFHWLSSQNEINEAAESLRAYRRRFTRKYQVVEGQVDTDELEKFESGGDGTVVRVKRENAILPIANPDLGPAINDAFIRSKDDFNIVSGTSAEARGQADATTATQAKITAAAATIRESAEQLDFSEFLILLGREVLKQAKENLILPVVIKATKNPNEQFLGAVQAESPYYQAVRMSQLDDGYDFEITLDVINSSPLAAQEEKAKFIEFLVLMNQFPQLALSPTLIRAAAHNCGYRDESVIHEMQQAAILNMIGQAQMMSSQNGGTGNNFAKEKIAQNNPNTADQIQAQLDQQNSGGNQ